MAEGSLETVATALRPLVGLHLAVTRRAADLRGFHFGEVKPLKGGSWGEYVLHIQCPWRLESEDSIVTGRRDLWEPRSDARDDDWDTWDYERDGNLQDERISTLFEWDESSRSQVNNTDLLVVEAVEADRFGGFALTLSGGYRLVAFPSGTSGEDWRLLGWRRDDHLVIEGGAVSGPPEGQ